MTETKSTLPAENSGTEITRFNALRHGVLSRYTVLPWEDAAEYAAWSPRLSPSTRRTGRPRSIWLQPWSSRPDEEAADRLPHLPQIPG